MKIRALIIDDEPVARNIIKEFLRDDEDLEIVGECGSGSEAFESIPEQKPDLIFLDIQMPEMDGFEVIEALGRENLPHIIFVTAYNQYAIKAFEINALDYLLKPFDKERFRKALLRAKEMIRANETIDDKIKNLVTKFRDEKKYLDRILIKNGGRIFFLKAVEINWIEAAAYYANLHTAKESHLIRDTLNNLENKLDPAVFIRIHRSYIVNIEFIKELQPWSKNSYVVILKDNTKLNLSRNYRERLFNLFDSKNQ
jgi:two-component system LytT family response regulator